jgi:hypothetical protein
MNTTPVDDHETTSTASDTSAAIVSLYNSWTSSSSSDDSTLGDFTLLTSEELAKEIKERNQDVPRIGHLKPHKRPTCRFLNFMGYQPDPLDSPSEKLLPVGEAVLDFNLDEKDMLFPLALGTKIKYNSEDDDVDSLHNMFVEYEAPQAPLAKRLKADEPSEMV